MYPYSYKIRRALTERGLNLESLFASRAPHPLASSLYLLEDRGISWRLRPYQPVLMKRVLPSSILWSGMTEMHGGHMQVILRIAVRDEPHVVVSRYL